MASKIEDMIEDIEAFIDECKYVPLSQTNISVNKEVIDDLLRELRMKTPEEIKRYQKIISNKEAILDDANEKAQQIIYDAQQYTDSMVNEHTIMQQAYEQANEVIEQATQQAQAILDQAVADANSIRMSAMQYTDDSLASIQSLLTTAIETTQARQDALISGLNQYLQVVNENRRELAQPAEEPVNGEYPVDSMELDQI